MVQSDGLHDAQIILLTTGFIVNSNLSQLQILAAEQTQLLNESLLCRLLLTYYPAESESIPNLVSFLTHLQTGWKDVSNLDDPLDTSAIQDLSNKELEHKLHELRINHSDQEKELTYDDEVGSFIVSWLRKIEIVSGISISALDLVEPFVAQRPKLGQWQTSYLTPLLKLQNYFYPGQTESLNIKKMETLHGFDGVRTLLQFAERAGQKAKIGRDLEEIVSPWVQGANFAKRRRLNQDDSHSTDTSWQDVNEWIRITARTNFDLAAKSFLEWDGPTADGPTNDHTDKDEPASDPQAAYAQTGLALITLSTAAGDSSNDQLRRVLDRAGALFARNPSPRSSANRELTAAFKTDLLDHSVLLPTNPITNPSEEVFGFLENCLTAQRALETFKISLAVVTIVEVALFGSEERQRQELIRILQQIPRLTRSEIDWPVVRQQLHKLRSGTAALSTNSEQSQSHIHFLSRVPAEYLESEFLNALIANGQYGTVKDIYLQTPNPPLKRDVTEQQVAIAIYASYDNASNGNRTRGGMKRANEILKAFQSQFDASSDLKHIDHLIRATHSLSFYQLTLEHGIPFQPATIRIHHDPVSLIEQVLAQNSKSFTKLDDLLEIGQNLVLADLANSSDSSYESKSLDERLFDVRHRITYLAINAALSDDDFDTAYSYITTRLSTSPSQTSSSQFTDDTSWRAAYSAGKHRPSHPPKNLHDRITSLSKRMDLLSLALTLTPTPDPLSEILATWRRCEEEIDSLKSQAVREERAVEQSAYGNSTLPGGFSEDRDMDAAETRRMMERRGLGGSGPSYEEDAPMGLFDIARGAASALRKSAFPLHGAGGQSNVRDRADSGSEIERDSFDEQRPSSEQQRLRKRDMVSNMVTGGLVSGMSWMLGAPPPKPADER